MTWLILFPFQIKSDNISSGGDWPDDGNHQWEPQAIDPDKHINEVRQDNATNWSNVVWHWKEKQVAG